MLKLVIKWPMATVVSNTVEHYLHGLKVQCPCTMNVLCMYLATQCVTEHCIACYRWLCACGTYSSMLQLASSQT